MGALLFAFWGPMLRQTVRPHGRRYAVANPSSSSLLRASFGSPRAASPPRCGCLRLRQRSSRRPCGARRGFHLRASWAGRRTLSATSWGGCSARAWPRGLRCSPCRRRRRCRGGDEAHIGLLGSECAEGLKLFLLDEPQELHLHRGRDVADLITPKPCGVHLATDFYKVHRWRHSFGGLDVKSIAT